MSILIDGRSVHFFAISLKNLFKHVDLSAIINFIKDIQLHIFNCMIAYSFMLFFDINVDLRFLRCSYVLLTFIILS